VTGSTGHTLLTLRTLKARSTVSTIDTVRTSSTSVALCALERGHEVAKRAGAVIGSILDGVRTKQPKLVGRAAIHAVLTVHAMKRSEESVNVALIASGEPELVCAQAILTLGTVRAIGTGGAIMTIGTVHTVTPILTGLPLQIVAVSVVEKVIT
jgi:hypothetical protein